MRKYNGAAETGMRMSYLTRKRGAMEKCIVLEERLGRLVVERGQRGRAGLRKR